MKRQRERKVIKKSENCWLVPLTITYNIKDPRQEKLLEQADSVPNFSGFIKHLQEAYLLGWDIRPNAIGLAEETRGVVDLKPVHEPAPVVEPVHDLIPEFKFDSVDAFL